MANPVAELEIPVKFEFSGKEFNESFNKQINNLTRDYRRIVKNIQASGGVNKSIAEVTAKSLIGGGLTTKLIEQNIKSRRTKSWTINQLMAKESRFQELNQLYTRKGYNEGLKTILFNKELGEGFYKERKKKDQDIEDLKLQKQKNKEDKRAIKNTRELNDQTTKTGKSFKEFGKGLFGNMSASKMVTAGTVGILGAVAGFLGKSVIDASTHRFENEARFGRRGARQVTGIERIMGILGGSYLSSAEAKELGATSARYIESKTQDITGLGSGIGNLAVRLGGRGSQYYGRYAQLLVKGHRTGEPEYEEMYKLAEEIARDKRLSQTDKAAFIKQITGSEEVAQTMLTALLAGKSFTTGEYADYVKGIQDVGLEAGKESKLLGYKSRAAVEKTITATTIAADRIVVNRREDEAREKEIISKFGSTSAIKETINSLNKNDKEKLSSALFSSMKEGTNKELISALKELSKNKTVVSVYNSSDNIQSKVEVNQKSNGLTTKKSQTPYE